MCDVLVLKDRQHKAKPVELWYIGVYFITLHSCLCQMHVSYYIPIIIKLCGLFTDIKYVKLSWTKTTRAKRRLSIYFLYKDISFNIELMCLQFSIHLDEGHLEKEKCLINNLWEIRVNYHIIGTRR